MAVLKNRDIVVVSQQPWDLDIGSTIKYTAAELAKNNRVLFVNQPVKRKYLLQRNKNEETKKRIRVLKGIDSEVEQIKDTMWVMNPKTVSESISKIKHNGIFDYLNKINDKRAVKRIQLAIEQLGFKDYFIINDNSLYHWIHLKELLSPSKYIFLLRDYVTNDSYHNNHGERLQERVITTADLTVTNCYFFQDYARKFNPNAHFVGQGCNLEMYDGSKTYDKPKDLQAIKGPVIGYTGALITRRLDLEMMIHLAKSRPNYSFVLVGPEDDDFKQSELHKMDNVHFLGKKKPEELPFYIQHFDVALNPQIINKVTDINYPLKIDEYLALGVPSLATKTTFMTQYFSDDVYLATTKEEYVSLLDKALEENSAELIEHRKKVAQSHSWGHFADRIFTHALKLENK